MEESESRKDPLAALAHELRNRIAPIRNAAHLLRLRGASDAGLQPVAQLIDRQLDAMVEALDAALAAGQAGGAVPAPQAQRVELATTAQAAAAPASRRRILIADDNAAMRESLSELLRDSGHEVQAAADGAQAVELATRWAPEVVLLDIYMPLVNGYEVARRLRALFTPRQMKLVMMSGMALDGVALRSAQQAGFDHCIDKVIDLAELEKLLSSD